jgi:hypothetical protein
MAKTLYDLDPLKAGEGTFRSLISTLGVKARRGDASFAVTGTFPVLSATMALDQASYLNSSATVDDLMQVISQRFSAPKVEEAVYYPSATAASQAGISIEVGIGGMAHESGHYLCDRVNASHDLPRLRAEFSPHLEAILAQYRAINENPHFRGVARWANILADIRLERLLAARYPMLRNRFVAVADWIVGLEKVQPTDEDPRLVGVAVRDLGKGWRTRTEVEAMYHPTIVAVADKLKKWWDFSPHDTADEAEWDSTLYFPSVGALAIFAELGVMPPPPPPAEPPKGKGKPKPPEDEGEEGEGGEGGEGGDEGGDEGGEEGGEEGGDEGGAEGGDEGGEEKGEGRREGKKPFDPAKARDTDALDPSSAFKKALEQAARPPHPVAHRPAMGARWASQKALSRTKR